MKSIKAKGRTRKHGPHTSVTLPALGSLPSVALSSGRVHPKYMKKTFIQAFLNNVGLLEGIKNGNFNCRRREKIIVVEHFFLLCKASLFLYAFCYL